MIAALSKYKILEKLGSGGMGEVYKAEDPALLRTVAIKVLAKHSPLSPDAQARFLREARIASQISHPHIVTIYEIGETSEHAYIVMEYVRGSSLRNLIAAGVLAPETVIKVALQICDAMTEAHSHGIIHRDIKPENILLNERNQVKVLDFGLAKPFGRPGQMEDADTVVERLTESGTVMGTLSYMSPEQLRGEELDERTDIFSFGIVLYEIITGDHPFTGANPFEVAASILKDKAIEIGRVPVGLPRAIVAVVMRCLQKDRKSRYATFADVKREVESLALKRDDEPALQPTVALSQAVRNSGKTSEEQARLTSPAVLVSKTAAPPTILVLPLEAVDSQEQCSFIGIGLAHAITTDLAKISGLSVLSKSAGAGRIDRAGRKEREVARELGATILLEGEVMRAGETIGIMARLTDVESGRVIWGDQYRGDASDLFSIQDAVCESIAAVLKVGISSEVREQIARPATTHIDAFEFYSKGRAYLERRDVKENIDYAIQMFKMALEIDSAFALAQAGMGEAYWLKYQVTHDNVWVERAISAGDRALVLDPYQAQVYISLGMVYYGTGKVDRAIEEFDRAIELQPMNDDAHRWLGRCYTRKGDMERARGYFEKAIQIRSGHWENYDGLGMTYYTFGRYRDAAEQFRRVITIQPDNFHGYSNLGAIYYLLGSYDDAVAMYQQAIKIYPNEDSYSNLGTAYFYLEQYEKAITAYKAAVELNPRNEFSYRNLGDAYLRVGREGDAEEQFRCACELIESHLSVNPDNAQLLGRLAVCEAKLKNEQKALASIERATELEPRNTTLMYRKAVVYALTGQTEKAIEHLSEALSHGYSRPEAERDPDLETLRDSAGYKRLFASQSS